MSIREPAVAGMFYPAQAEHLQRSIHEMLAEVAACKAESSPPKMIIVPHAGYIYSGPIAASAYQRLKPFAGTYQRVILLGPSHRFAFQGLALSESEAFKTPLGVIPIDLTAVEAISGCAGVISTDQAHRYEHSLEVQLPFLQLMLEHFTLVPIVVGLASADQVANVINKLWGGPETLFVISSDLSHYHDYMTAKQLDTETTHKILKLSHNLNGEQACGCFPLNGALLCAAQHHLTATSVDLRNSGDTAGSTDAVVGYGAYVLH
ncbi:AmmeMemoRadiSam system protein B [Zooshikella sp. RANM57]|uniref:AmmeMemoRadiSam system protein B n=1 Tax=Zooshikella sp. RANM57 TaxID=3425863 RepID=UPI003D6DBF16